MQEIKSTILSKVFLFALLVCIGAIAYGVWSSKPHLKNGMTIRVAEHSFVVDVAVTDSEQAQGLSGRSGLPEGHGMLFEFRGHSTPSFWMRGMNFSIDIIWIADGKIVGAVENAPADNGAKLYTPPVPIDFVLELPAGTVEKLQISAGDAVTY